MGDLKVPHLGTPLDLELNLLLHAATGRDPFVASRLSSARQACPGTVVEDVDGNRFLNGEPFPSSLAEGCSYWYGLVAAKSSVTMADPREKLTLVATLSKARN